MKNNDFNLKNLPVECRDTSISENDFKFVDTRKISHEQKFQTRPTTFLKDCIRRFKKNKSSVVASVILGLLLVLSVVVPVVDKNNIKTPHPESTYLQPKLFNAGTGFWDGTKKWTKIPVDTGANGFEETNRDENWWPNPERFKTNAVTNKTFSDVEYTNGESKYGKEGYVHFGYYYNIPEEQESVEFKTRPITARKEGSSDDTTLRIENTDKIYLTNFDTYNLEKIIQLEGKDGASIPTNYVLAPLSMYFTYEVTDGDEVKTKEIKLLDEQEVFDIGSKISSRSKDKVELAETIRNESGLNEFSNASFVFRMKNQKNKKNTCALIRSIAFDAQLANEDFNNAIEITNFTDATECVLRTINEPKTSIKNRSFWLSNGVKNVHMSKIVYCTFTYDSYEAAYGDMMYTSFPLKKLEEYAKKGWIKWKVYSEDDASGKYHITSNSTYTVVNKDKSPVIEFKNVVCDEETGEIFADVLLSYYKFYGYEKMPKFLMGTDKSGYDMLKYAFEGLRTSLILGILTFVICFLFGLFYGSVSGYFGGAVDLIMERITDILSGVPWIVVMTLVIIKAQKSTFWVLLLALCMTGWIGTAATTRTQFYRFRGREYVLASRTLGASDARLIAKHVLPNAMGTIITGAVLMIPSVIFSEATISYLGLGFKNLSSLGVILSNNQSELTTNSYLLIFPSVIIALLMISFNLFGNGLRDAVNPSLKGED